MLQQQIAGAQISLENTADLLRRAGADIGQCDAQLQILSRLQHRVDSAGPGALAALHAEVVAMVAATQISAQQALTTAGVAQSADAALQATTLAARSAVSDFTRDFYERKIFDPYLHFASKEDEDAYHRRETDRREAIEKAMAKGTPQGTLEANNLAEEQLKDAGMHGADRSADYAPLLKNLSASKATLSAALKENELAASNGLDRLTIAKDSALDSAAEKIDPAVMAAFGSLVSHTSISTPEGSGVTANVRSERANVGLS